MEKQKKKWYKKWWIWLLLIVIIGAFSQLKEKESEPKKVGEVANNQTKSETTSETKAEKTTFNVGEKVELNKITVTLLSVKESTGSEFNKVQDGYVYLLPTFLIENNSDKEIIVSSMISFNAYVDGFATSLDIGALVEKDDTQLDGKVAPGKKIQGQIGYKVKKDYKELEISYSPDFWGKEIKFVYKK